MGKTLQKAHTVSAAAYDGLFVLPFDVVTPGGAITNAAISAILVLPVSCKIFAVSITQLTGANFVTAFNVISGVAADASPANPIGTNDTTDTYTLTSPGGVTGGPPATVAAAGTALFAADQAVVLAAAVGQTFFNPNFDVIWPAPQSLATTGNTLTLRLVTAGAGGACKVTLLCKSYDLKAYSPRGFTAGFLPSTDIF